THLEIVRVALVVEDVAPGERCLIEMPDERLVFEWQLAESVRIDLHDRRVVYPFEQVLAIGLCGLYRPVPGWSATRTSSRSEYRHSDGSPFHTSIVSAFR